ncbi:hypothetical protein HDU80_006714 [Chytriomyces hyalinus]|nr:hypothetical protein HDU80_006714 [Chytriomyces hyalinus]
MSTQYSYATVPIAPASYQQDIDTDNCATQADETHQPTQPQMQLVLSSPARSSNGYAVDAAVIDYDRFLFEAFVAQTLLRFIPSPLAALWFAEKPAQPITISGPYLPSITAPETISFETEHVRILPPANVSETYVEDLDHYDLSSEFQSPPNHDPSLSGAPVTSYQFQIPVTDVIEKAAWLFSNVLGGIGDALVRASFTGLLSDYSNDCRGDNPFLNELDGESQHAPQHFLDKFHSFEDLFELRATLQLKKLLAYAGTGESLFLPAAVEHHYSSAIHEDSFSRFASPKRRQREPRRPTPQSPTTPTYTAAQFIFTSGRRKSACVNARSLSPVYNAGNAVLSKSMIPSYTDDLVASIVLQDLSSRGADMDPCAIDQLFPSFKRRGSFARSCDKDGRLFDMDSVELASTNSPSVGYQEASEESLVGFDLDRHAEEGISHNTFELTEEWASNDQVDMVDMDGPPKIAKRNQKMAEQNHMNRTGAAHANRAHGGTGRYSVMSMRMLGVPTTTGTRRRMVQERAASHSVRHSLKRSDHADAFTMGARRRERPALKGIFNTEPTQDASAGDTSSSNARGERKSQQHQAGTIHNQKTIKLFNTIGGSGSRRCLHAAAGMQSSSSGIQSIQVDRFKHGARRRCFEYDFLSDDTSVRVRTAIWRESCGDAIIGNNVGLDATRALAASYETLSIGNCLAQRYIVGYVDRASVGCSATQFIQGAILFFIVLLLVTRFVMAFIFYWCLAGHIVFDKENQELHLPYRKRRHRKPKVLVSSVANPNISQTTFEANLNMTLLTSSRRNAPLKSDPFVIILVTCYSETIESIQKTVDSLARTDYPDMRKLLFIVCDGLVTGSDCPQSTPEAVISLISKDSNGEDSGTPSRQSYLAIADGERQLNMATVHHGYYDHSAGGKVPMVAVIKCGSLDEENTNRGRSGNRGKRDSQMILMNFLSSVNFNDGRMTPLDFDLATKIQSINGDVSASEYSLVLMVDADTAVDELSLYFMVQAMKNDSKIMGHCGETRIENKTDSWVTQIQVFEYYISHHLGKAFESVFGGVTCLPGCFSMYRIKGDKLRTGRDKPSPEEAREMVPLLIHPEIMSYYKEFIVDT